MKIKAVCEATGLTDRTIRYYIDENLIQPAYTENYLGRKTFDFSEGDIQQLKDIAVLRKFGFSITQISTMIQQPECIVQICKELQERKQASVNAESAMLGALTHLDPLRQYTVSDLAAVLTKPVSKTHLPEEDSKAHFRRSILLFMKSAAVFLITWIPVVLGVKAVVDYCRFYQYPIFDLRGGILLAVLVLPTALILLVPKLIHKASLKRTVKFVLVVLCVLITPINYFLAAGSFSVSETANHHNYLQLDACCQARGDLFFHDLFPARPVYNEDTVYFYCYRDTLFGNTCDIYTEWFLDSEEFSAEISRVTALYENYVATDRWDVITVQSGSYDCLVLYTGNPPFEEVEQDYVYYIFAYNAQSGKVRYIFCNSDIGGNFRPYYLTLDWE